MIRIRFDGSVLSPEQGTPVSRRYHSDSMRAALDNLLEDLTLTRLALGIALAWALVRIGDGIGTLITTFLTHYDGQHTFSGQPLTWYVGDRALTFGALLHGFVVLAVVLLAALLIERRRSRA